MRRFDTAFLDRDGTLNVLPAAGGYVLTPDELHLLPGAAAAVRRLNARGVCTVLVSNQRAVARGLMSVADVGAVHARLAGLLAGEGAHLDALYFCPHEAGTCRCRKPAPGMLYQAAREHPQVRLDRAVLVGDAETDVGAGAAAGIATVRLADGAVTSRADLVVRDLGEAVDWILAQ